MLRICSYVKFFAVLFAAFLVNSCIDFPATGPPRRVLEVELYARQFQWYARYPGSDSVFGKTNFRMISDENPLGLDTSDAASADDVIVTEEFHLPQHFQIRFRCRSRDVIHSAFLPNFRVQMNCVPGMTTLITITTDVTTREICENKHDPHFHFMLLCNKICGNGHFNMKMRMVVETREEFGRWYAGLES